MMANLSQNINIDIVAEHLRVSRSTLTRAFRQSSEQSFNNFLQTIRMQQAYALLRERALNLADCAQRCGFNDPAYFSKVFKKHFGFAPKKLK
jgi:AraC-like DNA-binding protein